MSESQTIIFKPTFFIIGAPKCGTTSMAAWLSEHPNIFMSVVKEPHFFSTDLNMPTRQTDYDALFADTGTQHVAIGESSTEYLYSDVAVPQILALQPYAKFVVMIRNPTDLVWSWHQQLLFMGRQPLVAFDDAWTASGNVRQQIAARVHYAPRLLDYQYVGALGSRLQTLLKHISQEQLQVIVLDDIKRDPSYEYQRLLSFLEVKVPWVPSSLTPQHVGIARRSTFLSHAVRRGVDLKTRINRVIPTPTLGILKLIARINRSDRRTARMADNLRASVSRSFLPEIELLEKILDRRFDDWKMCGRG